MDFIATSNALNWTDKIQRMMFKRIQDIFQDFIGTSRENPCLYNIMLYVFQNSMLSEIEKFLFENNQAHLLLGVEKSASELTVVISPTEELSNSTSFVFYQTENLLEKKVWEESVSVTFPTNIIGFDSTKLVNGKWKFCLHTDEIEWNFISNWPKRLGSS